MMKGGKRKKKDDCSRGRRTVDAEDRISSLPDSLLQHIMRFLGIVSVIRTSLLSRRWRHLWKSAPFLDFDYDLDYLSSDIVANINGSLMLYEARKIGRLHVDTGDKSKLDPCTIDPWIRFAARHDVEELDMHFFSNYHTVDEMFKLPRCVLDCETLRVLKLGHCVLNFPSSFNLSSLTEIHLYGVQLTHLDASGCPLLEKLIIRYCHRNNLDVCAPGQKLRYMMMEDGDQTFKTDYGPSGLTLDAPYLLLIEFTRHLKGFYNLKNLSSLQTATFNLSEYCSYKHGGDPVALMELLKNVSHTKTVKLSYDCIERLEGNFNLPTLGATCLDLEVELNWSIPVLTSFLKSSPCLETLIIKICSKYEEVIWYADKYSISKLALWDLELALSNLQINTVGIHDFLQSQSQWFHMETDPSPYMNKFLKNCLEVKLLKILLKCCKSLKRITIHTIKECWLEPNFLCALKEKLLALPRGSENVMIDIS